MHLRFQPEPQSRRAFRSLLLALLLAGPALALTSSGPSTTPNDPFHHLALQAAQKSKNKTDDQPVCCLRPLATPDGQPDEDVLLSFEEWKAKQLASVRQAANYASEGADGDAAVTAPGAAGGTAPFEQTTEVPLPAASTAPAGPAVPDAPYFRIPLTDRFNYASTDCSARVHTSHAGARSRAAILTSKKDRYMLSPCNVRPQFVVVELCDDIRIDTVQMANYEFFSGVFKDFTVSVAKTYTADIKEWVVAGTYRARNERAVQSFHPPTTLGDFYRFIRIDFHSHYGNEYYCPVSLLRVYGLTHLEHWKWDLWEAESRNKRSLEGGAVVVEVPQQPTQPAGYWEPTPVDIGHQAAAAVAPTSEQPAVSADYQQTGTEAAQPGSLAHTPTTNTESPPVPIEASARPQHSTEGLSSATSVIYTPGYSGEDAYATAPHNANVASTAPQRPPTHVPVTISDIPQHTSDTLYNTNSISEPSASHSVSLSLSASSSSGSSAPPAVSSHSSSSSSSQSNHSVNGSRPSTVSTQSHSLTVVSHASPPPPASSGESIYRTIMNRLSALETNTTLYARFVEDHTASVRDMIRKLGEDVGRLEGLGKAQAQVYQRSVAQFERQQQRLELEHTELLQRVSRLMDEVVLEKRLGIAQLCLLLAVFVFMALTRGSRNEPVPQSAESVRARTSSTQSWGNRTFNVGGEWVNRFTSRSVSPPPTREPESVVSEDTPQELKARSESSSQGVQAGDAFPRSKRVHPVTGRKLGIAIRPRTPTTARSLQSSRSNTLTLPLTPTRTAPLVRTGPRPPIERSHSSAISQSFSMGMIPPGPRSVKHWARTAHLHEVKSSGLSLSAGSTSRGKNAASLRVDTALAAAVSIRQEEDVFGPSGRARREIGEQREGETERSAADSHAQSTPVRLASRGDLPVACAWSAARHVEGDASEGDNWVDTDADESGSEVGSLYDRRESVVNPS